ncbi:hypothetical protein HPB51_002005 [Rhipicephalus microplus]|uniref:PiggyBac transposable element-derived protein domain-containing protein n=1 Tax=Rhipicephalus microplus TaxID=6941 RepID=A0A9J6EX27_RHIMP|nr:hypothetical protein HPB51_002005 [Rhipicephalus microplus]
MSGDSSDEGDAIQTEVKEAEEEVATSTDAPSVDRTPRNMKRRYTWVKKDFDIEAGSFENNFPLPPAEPLSAVEYFDVFVSRSMLKAVVDESNKYYFQKHGTTLNLTVEKLTPVLGMFFRMGLVNMHRRCNKGFYGSQGGYQLGLGAAVVLQLCSSLPKRDDNLVVADNFFTGPQLVEELSRMGIFYIGTTFEIIFIPSDIDEMVSDGQKEIFAHTRRAFHFSGPGGRWRRSTGAVAYHVGSVKYRNYLRHIKSFSCKPSTTVSKNVSRNRRHHVLSGGPSSNPFLVT